VIRPFPSASGKAGELKIIGRFEVGDIELQVLESLGGHVPAQAFFYAPQQGLLFCGDYLIDFSSLSDRAKSTLSIARFLMTSTNSDSRVFGQEMGCLARLMLEAHAQQQTQGKSARIFPGHGEFYRVDEAEAMLKELASTSTR
jgi:glyoxylase-like metal-dependent hydrolase (beta-lactamase superfamily II)